MQTNKEKLFEKLRIENMRVKEQNKELKIKCRELKKQLKLIKHIVVETLMLKNVDEIINKLRKILQEILFKE
jgi:hypothetical protein